LVLGCGVVGGVHTDRRWVVVLGHRYRATQANLQPGAGAATTTEEVHHDLIVYRVEAKAILGFEVERVFLE
jgi:hypothetical protein